MTASIKECQDALAALLQADEELGGMVDHIFEYRTLKGKLPTTMRITYIGGSPSTTTVLGTKMAPSWKYAIPVFVQHDGTAAEEQAAEDACNAIEMRVYDILLAHQRTDQWLSLSFFRDSIRPPAPASLTNIRYMELYVSVQPL